MYWHTLKEDTVEKWENILQLYNNLLILEYSPVAALNRTFALAKARGKEPAIVEAKKLNISNSHFYFSLLGNPYSGIARYRALSHFKTALNLAHIDEEKKEYLQA